MRGKVAELSFEGKFLRKAMKSQEIRRNSLALLLHNTVGIHTCKHPIINEQIVVVLATWHATECSILAFFLKLDHNYFILTDNVSVITRFWEDFTVQPKNNAC